jgi:hypothetical protein
MGSLGTPSLNYTLSPSLSPSLNPIISASLTPSLSPNLTPSFLSPSVISSPSISKIQQNVYIAINNSNLSYDQKVAALSSFTTRIIVFIIQYSSLVSGVGAVLYALGTIVQIDAASIITNNTGRIIVNSIILLCGVITVLEWVAVDILINSISGFYNRSN